MRLFVALILLLFACSKDCWAERWPASISNDLKSQQIIDSQPLDEALENWDGSNPYLLLTLKDGQRAVFRSEDEPWGSVAEVAACRMDRALGTELVPPTVARTLQRDELGDKWPWSTDLRVGSLQLFVEGAQPAHPERLSQDDLANSEILCFLLGRYDNHSGNLLVDKDGRAVLVDFEGSLDLQKVQYGDFPFIKRGGRFAGGLGVPVTDPFPFETPLQLVDPSLEEIRKTFGPWWGQIWPQGMDLLYRLLNGIPERTVPYAIWDERLWVQIRVRSRHPAFTDNYPETTMSALEALTEERLEDLLETPFSEVHIRQILERRKQLLRAATRWSS
jgi:hypothetical protein